MELNLRSLVSTILAPFLRLGTVLAALIVFTSCSTTITTHGHRVDPERLTLIQPGASTRDEVFQLLGSPSTVGSFDATEWYYITRTTERRSFYQADLLAQDVVTIRFDKNGVVSEVAVNDIVTARAVDPIDRETPTAGNELSVLEQFVGNIGRFNLPQDADTGGS